MITTPNDVILRNLEEQVLENKEQIAKHWEVDRVLADFGITVMGQVPSVDDLPASEVSYGFAYLVGAAVPYEVYIWTRANPNIGKNEPYWLNIGYISTIGPQGPVGPQGPQGEPGTGITAIRMNPNYTITFTYGNGLTFTTDSIRGPQGQQGIQGPQGRTGETGPQGQRGPAGPVTSLNIRGILENTSQLPTASTSNPGDAFIVGPSIGNYIMYVLTGETPSTYAWTNIGAPGVGTIVTVGGTAVSEFDADTKVDKFGEGLRYSVLLIRDGYGGNYTTKAVQTSLSTTAGGTFTTYYDKTKTDADTKEPAAALVTCNPIYAYHAANKDYVDTKIRDALESKTCLHTTILYGPALGGTQIVVSGQSFNTYTSTDTHDLPWSGGTALPITGPASDNYFAIKFNTSDLEDAYLIWQHEDEIVEEPFTEHFPFSPDSPILVYDIINY